MKHLLLLFDIDGTLLHAGGCGKSAIDRVFEHFFGVQNAWGNTFPDGKTDLLIFNEIAERCIERKLTMNEWAEMSNLYAEFFAEDAKNSVSFRVIPGVSDLLNELSLIPKIHLSVATGNIEKVSWMKLRKAKLDSFFRCGGFGAKHSNRTGILTDAIEASSNHFKKQYLNENIYVIGDTRHDIIAAHALNLRSVGVDTGSTKGKDFKEIQPHHRFSNFCDSSAFVSLFSNLTQ